MASLKGKTLFITGGSRGIGLAIAAKNDEVLAEAGTTDVDRYATEPGRPPIPDFFVD